MPGGRKQWVTVRCKDGEKRSFLTPMWYHFHYGQHEGLTKEECPYMCAHCGVKVQKPLKNHVCDPKCSGGRNRKWSSKPAGTCPKCRENVYLYIIDENKPPVAICGECGYHLNDKQ